MKNKYVRCFDKFGVELKEGDIVDVQMDGEHEIYKKEDGQLYFKPYGKEDRVSAYFSNDMIKVERNLKLDCEQYDGQLSYINKGKILKEIESPELKVI